MGHKDDMMVCDPYVGPIRRTSQNIYLQSLTTLSVTGSNFLRLRSQKSESPWPTEPQ